MSRSSNDPVIRELTAELVQRARRLVDRHRINPRHTFIVLDNIYVGVTAQYLVIQVKAPDSPSVWRDVYFEGLYGSLTDTKQELRLAIKLLREQQVLDDLSEI